MAIERGTVIDGKYEILKEIGRGGMSVVYLAMDNRLNKQWAVKVLQRQGIGKNNEIIINKVPDDTELMKRLDHPAIPRIVDIIDRPDDPQIYIVMDYVEGESLDKVLEEFGAQPQDLVIDWAKQICDTLGYLHSQKPPIIYRDMKPANIMLKPEGNIKLIDFGIAREFKEQNLADTTALGTRGYASPEHFGGRTDARSDIFTLGMTMHHLLTGADPRPKSYEYFPIREYNPELSSGLEHIIDKCTAWDPDDRYQNCNELMYDLEHYNEIDDDFRRKQKNKLIVFIVAIAAAILFAILGVVFGILTSTEYSNLANSTDENQLKQAIGIDSSKQDAYLNLIKNYKKKGITADNISAFITLFDSTSMSKTSKEYFDVKYALATAILFNYSEKDFASRISQAGQYFEEIVKDDKNHVCSEYSKAVIYNDMYQFYVQEADHDDPTKESLSKLLNSYESFVEDIKKDETNTYAKAMNLSEVFSKLHDQSGTFAKCNISQQQVQSLLDNVYEIAKGMSSTNKETSEYIQDIINNYEEYSEDLKTDYQAQGGTK